jgi:hypothetical protein
MVRPHADDVITVHVTVTKPIQITFQKKARFFAENKLEGADTTLLVQWKGKFLSITRAFSLQVYIS